MTEATGASRALAEPHGQGLLVVGGDPGEDVRALAELQQPGPGVAEGAPRQVELDLVHADQALRGPEGGVRISAASSTV